MTRPRAADLPPLLQVAPTPQRHWDDATVHAALMADPGAYLGYLHHHLAAIGRGEGHLELPAKQLFVAPDPAAGDFRVMPCIYQTADGKRHQTVKIVGTNLRRERLPGQITVGEAIYLDTAENFVAHRFDACLLSSARTGACAALAAASLAPGARRACVIGSGRVGYYSARYLAALLPGLALTLADRQVQRARGLAALLQDENPGLPVTLAGHHPRDTDILVLATDSLQPVYTPADFAARLVISLGADSDLQSELSADFPLPDTLYVDSHDSLRFGDLQRWQQAGRLAQRRVVAMTELLAAQAPPAGGDGQQLFVSSGSALLDCLTMAYLVKRSGATAINPA